MNMDSNYSQTAIASTIWVFCSVGMLVFNKLAIAYFPLECSLVGLQMLFTILILVVLGWKSLHVGSLTDLLRWLRVAPFFAGMLLSSILALKDAPMSLVIVFRGLAPFFSLAVERFFPEPMIVSPMMTVCLFGMLVGICMYAWQLPSNHLSGVGWVILNNIFVIGDRLLQRLMLSRDQSPVDISKTSATVINNFAGAAIMMVGIFVNHEFAELPRTIATLTTPASVTIGLSCVVGVAISYVGIWLQSLISATSFLVLATGNKFGILFIEGFLFTDGTMSMWQGIGACTAILFGMLYGKAKEAAEKTNSEASSFEAAKESDPLVKVEQKA